MIQNNPCLVEELRCLGEVEMVFFDERSAFLDMGQVVLVGGVFGVAGFREGGVDDAHGAFGPEAAGWLVQALFEDGLYEAVDDEQVGLAVAVQQRVFAQYG